MEIIKCRYDASNKNYEKIQSFANMKNLNLLNLDKLAKSLGCCVFISSKENRIYFYKDTIKLDISNTVSLRNLEFADVCISY